MTSVGETAMATVLVLDDRPPDRELLATVLRYAGYAVDEASSARVALDLARAKRPDLIAADIPTPQMNGFEFMRLLRSDPAISEIPVVFSTSTYDEEEARRLARACGVAHILVKPAPPEEVMRVVSSALGRDKSAAW